MTIPVRAKALGYYDGSRRYPGETFAVARDAQIGSWMVALEVTGGVNPEAPPQAPTRRDETGTAKTGSDRAGKPMKRNRSRV